MPLPHGKPRALALVLFLLIALAVALDRAGGAAPAKAHQTSVTPSATAAMTGVPLGDVCAEPRYTFKLKASQVTQKIQRFRGPVYLAQARIILTDGEFDGVSGSIWLKKGYQQCSLKVGNVDKISYPDEYTPWPYLGYAFSLPEKASTVTVRIGRIYHPHGTNCGGDALKVTMGHRSRATTGATKRIHIRRLGNKGWSWSGKGLHFCSQRAVNENGKVLMSTQSPKAGRYRGSADLRDSFLIVTARIKE